MRSEGWWEVRDGCYLINYTPAGADLVSYDGTLRVHTEQGRVSASADLYQRDLVISNDPEVLSGTLVLGPPPDATAGIPTLPIASYRYYLRVAHVLQTGRGFHLAFDALRFSAAKVALLDGTETHFPKEASLTAFMGREGEVSDDHFVGDVTNEVGTVVGRLSMRFVSAYLRKATIVIHHVAVSERPIDNGAGLTWRALFETVGWDLTLSIADRDVEEPSGESWTDEEGIAGLIALSSDTDINLEWRYQVLAVRLLDRGDPGIMFPGSNREGCVVASGSTFSNDEKWGVLKGVRAGDSPATYFRSATHEIGHAMGLEHNFDGFAIMRPTNGIAETATPAAPFPNNILWSFARDDEHRLHHWPDLIVRPGGLKWTAGGDAPIIPMESDTLRLEVSIGWATVPLGTPLRVDLALINVSARPVSAPAGLSLQSGFVRGLVVDSSGVPRGFYPLKLFSSNLAQLEPGTQISDSLTFSSGTPGALFPVPGAYRIIVNASWPFAKTPDATVSGEARVEVTG